MTREETRDAVKVMEAYANGKKIQYLDNNNKWIDAHNPAFDWYNCDYRIKPEPKYRPFKTQEECWEEMHKHPDFGWVKNDIGNIFKIIVIFNDSIKLNECNSSYSELFKTFKFTDGTPFGLKEEQL